MFLLHLTLFTRVLMFGLSPIPGRLSEVRLAKILNGVVWEVTSESHLGF